MTDNAKRDENRITTLLAVSNDGSLTPVDVYVDAVTHRLLVNSTVTGSINTIGRYKLADEDSSSDPAYYGYVDTDGNWFILKITDSAGTYRYKSGSSEYTTNWTGRAALSYDYYYNEF